MPVATVVDPGDPGAYRYFQTYTLPVFKQLLNWWGKLPEARRSSKYLINMPTQ